MNPSPNKIQIHTQLHEQKQRLGKSGKNECNTSYITEQMVAKMCLAPGEGVGREDIPQGEDLMHKIVTRVLLLDWARAGQYTIRKPIDLIRAATGVRRGSNC